MLLLFTYPATLLLLRAGLYLAGGGQPQSALLRGDCGCRRPQSAAMACRVMEMAMVLIAGIGLVKTRPDVLPQPVMKKSKSSMPAGLVVNSMTAVSDAAVARSPWSVTE